MNPIIHRSSFIIGLALLPLSLWGGMQFYLQPGALWLGVGLGWLVILWAAWLIVTHRAATPLLPPLLWLLAGLSMATLANLDIAPSVLGQFWLYCLALSVVIVANHYLNPMSLYISLWWAGLFYPLVWGVATLGGWWDSPNIVAFWPFLFVVIGFHSRIWFYLLPHAILLLALGSRGALIGSFVPVWVSMWLAAGRPRLSTSTLVLHSLAIPVLAWLFYWRPASAEIRLSYWGDAWAAWLNSPFWGVGPGGLNARRLIVESPGVFQLHAHNIFVTWAAQTGVIGLVSLWEAGRCVTELRHSLVIERWQVATLAGLLAWSLVDEPLFWPGPLVVTALIIGTIQERIN